MKKTLLSLLLLTGISTFNTVKGQYVVFQDSFEEYSDFAISDVGDWTLTDLDGFTTYGFTGINFPNSGAAKSFQVFNSTTTSPAMTPSGTSNWTARTGKKIMVSFAATQSPWNNDWLISPQIQLPADGGQLSFWAKNCDANYGSEKYRVYISTTGKNAPSDFTPISDIRTTPADMQWREFTYNLSDYANQNVYIAIQCTSQDQFGFAIDDFKITTSIAPTTAPNCASLNSPANSATNITTTPTLSWTSVAGAESYDVYLGTDSNPTTLLVNTTANSFTITTPLEYSTTYYWKVVPKNSIGEATGCSVYSFTTFEKQYCTASATSTSTLFERIDYVQFADISNSSPVSTTVGYEDFTSVVGNVIAGQTYTITVNSEEGVYSSDEVIVWIDFNGNKDFTDAGETFNLGMGNGPTWTGSITIPADATIGTTRMRIRLHDSSIGGNSTPCGTSTYGQVEDYSLNIGTLAVADVAKHTLVAYPNPVVDVYNISAQAKIKSVQVHDITGRAMTSTVVNDSKTQIDFSRFAAGLYVVTLTFEDGSKTSSKVVKK